MNNSSLLVGISRTSGTYRLVIPALSTYTLNQAGVRFYIVESDNDSPLFIKTDKTIEEIFTVGTGKWVSEEQFFRMLYIRNSTADVITIDLFVGFGEYIDNRTTIVGNRLSSVLPVIEPKTLFVAHPDDSIDAGSGINFNGVPTGNRLRRKCIMVTNLDPTLNIVLQDTSINDGLTIFPNTSVTVPTSEEVNVANENGSAVAVNIAEIWWLKPTA